MKTRSLLLAAVATILGVQTAGAGALTQAWKAVPPALGLDTTTGTDRQLAYNPVSGNILIVKRSPAVTVIRVKGIDGTSAGSDLSLTGVSGGTYPISSIGVGGDGAIYAANLVTAVSSTAPLKVYKWTSEAATATTIYSGDPRGNTTATRMGDRIAVRGSGNSTQILLGSDQAWVAMLTTDGSTWTTKKLTPTGGSANYKVASTFLSPGDAFYAKNQGNNVSKVTFNLSAGTAASTTLSIDRTSGGMDYNPVRSTLAMVGRGPSVLFLYDAANLSKPVLMDSAAYPDAVAESVGQAAAAFNEDGTMLFTLMPNNDLVAWTVGKADQTITFNAIADKTFGTAAFALTASASSGQPVAFAVLSGPATITDGNTLTLNGMGQVVVRASQTGTANWNPAASVDRSFAVIPDVVWTNSAGGDWSVAANWAPNIVPGNLNTAWITNDGTYTVSVTGNVSVASVQLGGESGEQTLKLSASLPGTLALSGDFSQSANGHLEFELAGTTPGTGFSQVAAGGAANFAGTLKLMPVNSFHPALGDTFSLLTAGSTAGTFAAFNYPTSDFHIAVGYASGIAVTVDNTAPTIAAIAAQTIPEEVAFSLQLTATDADVPVQYLTWNLVSGPSGLSVSSSGLLTWTPTEAQGPGSYPVVVTVADDGPGGLSASTSLTITVSEVNVAPVLAAISDQAAQPGFTFTTTATASDPDVPANTLTYSLVASPVGMAINPSSGVITWAVPDSAAGSVNLVTVQVSDGQLTDSKSFNVTVGALPSASPTVYVDTAYAGLPYGTLVTFPAAGGSGSYTIGVNAMPTVQGGVNRATGGGAVNIAAGRYDESVSLTKVVNLVTPTPGKVGITSVVSGANGLTKGGLSELVLEGANTFTGNLTNKAGTLTLDNDLAAGQGKIYMNVSSPSALHTSKPLTAITNDVVMAGSVGSTIEVNADLGGILALNGIVSGPHAWSVNGKGSVRLGGVAGFNTFGGALVVAQGTLIVAKDQALGSAANNTVVNNGAAVAFDGGFEYSSISGVKGITLNGGATLKNLGGDNTFIGTVSLQGDSFLGADAGTLNLNGPITGAYKLTKVGAGTVDLTAGGHTFTQSLINEGTIGVWYPASLGTGLATVAEGGTLTGNGSVPGGVDLSGTISPGDIPDTLDTGAETWRGGGSYLWHVDNALGVAGGDPLLGGWDMLNISGALDIAASSASPFTIKVGSLDFGVGGPGLALFDNTADYSWVIATSSSPITGFDSAAFAVDDTAFQNAKGFGKFVVEQGSATTIVLKFIHPPFIVAQPQGAAMECSTGPASLSVTASGTGALSYQWKKDGSDIAGATTTFYSIPTVSLADTANYTVQVTGAYGVTNSAAARLQVVDTLPPTITCPPSVAVNTDAGQCYASGVDLGTPTTFDNCGVASVANDAPAHFPVGTTVVTWTVTDTSGHATSCTQNVVVTDNQLPVVACRGITVTLDANGEYTLSPSDIAGLVASATDNCGIASTNVSKTVFNYCENGANVVTVTVTDTHGLVATCTPTITVNVPTGNPAVTYVDPAYAAPCHAVTFAGHAGNFYVGYNAFATVQGALMKVASGGTVYVAPGTYVEDLYVSDAVSLIGPNAGKPGTDPSRGPEAILQPATSDPEAGQILYLGASHVTIDGFTFDGDNPALTGGYPVGGVDVNTSAAIQNNYFFTENTAAFVDHLGVSNNVIKNITYDGIYFDVGLNSTLSWNYIRNNKFDNMWEGLQTYGPHTVIADNTFVNVDRGLSLHGTTGAAEAGFEPAVLRNTVTIRDPADWAGGRTRVVGIWINYRRDNAPALEVAENTVNFTNAIPAGKVGYGFWGLTIDAGRKVAFRDNVVNGNGYCTIGFLGSTIDPAADVLVSGGSLNGIAGYGAFAGRVDTVWGNGPAVFTVSNVVVNVSAGGTGIYSWVTDTNVTDSSLINLVGGTTINGGATSVAVLGGNARVAFPAAGSPVALAAPANNYIFLGSNGATVSSTDIDATSVLFDGAAGSGMTLAQLYATEDKIVHKVDNLALGFVRVKAANVFVTQNSGSIERGIQVAAAADTVNVAAGTFTEGPQIVIGKDLTIAGSGIGVTTVKPAGDTGTSGDARGWWLIQPCFVVNFSGLTFDGTGRLIWQAIRDLGKGTIQNVRFTGIQYQASGDAYAGTAVATYGGCGARDISDCQFDQIGRVGVLYFGPGTTGTYARNTYLGKGAGNWLDYGVEVGGGAVATITQSVISGNLGVAAVDGSTSAGVMVTTYFGPGTAATISNNTITGNTEGIAVGYDAADSSVVVAHNNDLSGNTAAGVSSIGASVSVNAELNWWGSAQGPFNEANVGGNGVAAVGPMDFSPWLGDGTDTDPAIGFQPNAAPIYYVPAALAFSQQPGGALIYQPLAPQPAVTVLNEIGAPALQFSGPVTLALDGSPAGVSLAGVTTVNAVAGVASFSGLAVDHGGAFKLAASSLAPITAAVSDSFTIDNSLPALTSVSPYWARAGGAAFTLTVTGTGFVPNSVVLWNGTARTTTFVSATQITAAIDAADIASAGTAQVKVSNPAPGGGDSAELAFRIEPATPAVVYVDDSYAAKAADDLVDWPYTGVGTHIIGYDAFATIQGGLTAVASGGTVNVAAGSYTEDVVVDKPLSLLGAGAGQSVVVGTMGDATIATIRLGAPGITVDGFTITRAGNNATDWNAGLNTAGLAIQGVANNGSTVRNCWFEGNRTAIDINLSGGHVIANNVITNNRTGLLLRNDCQNNSISNNAIVDNWTVGVLWLDSGGISQLAQGTVLSGNNISGNWYAQVQDRRLSSSSPAPDTWNCSGNWYGTATPTSVSTNTAEPGYAALVPAWYGGSAVNPGGAPAFAGVGVGYIDYTPYLDSGTDTSPAIGFQGSLATLHVTAAGAQTGTTGRIQEALGLQPLGGSILVHGGAYNENVVVTAKNSIIGDGSGTTASDTIITAANASLPAIAVNDIGGTGAGDRLTIKNLRVTGSTGAGGIQVNADTAPSAFLRFENVAAVQNLDGIALAGAQNVGQVQVANCALDNNAGAGFRIASTIPVFDTLEMTGGHLNNNAVSGLSVNPQSSLTQVVTHINLDGTTFAANGNGTAGAGDLSLSGFNGDASIQNVSIAAGGKGVPFRLVGKGSGNNALTWAASGNVLIKNFALSGTLTNQGLLISRYTDVAGITLQQVDLRGYVAGMVNPGPETPFMLECSNTTPLNLADTKFPNMTPYFRYALVIAYTGGAAATCQTVFEGAYTPAAKEFAVFDTNDNPGLGDVTFPVLFVTCPPAMTVEAAGPSGVVTIFGPLATDACDPFPVVTSTPASGSLFALGVNTVECVVRDSLGNSNTCTFTINVIDSTPPKVYCPPTQFLSAGPGCQAALPDLTLLASATDAVGPVTISQDPPAGTMLPLGTNTVIIRATDGHFNSSTCPAAVVVRDTTGPAVTCPADIVQGVDAGQAYATVSFTPTATDNCDPAPVITAAPPSGSQFPAGTTTVTVTATDNRGNASQCTFTVEVLAVAPTIVTAPASQTNMVGNTVVFSVTAAGTAPLSYQWQKDGAPILGKTEMTLLLENIKALDAADYTVVVTNLGGAVTSAPPAALVVVAQPVLTIINYTNSTATLKVDGTTGYPYAIEGTLNFVTWTPLFTNTAPYIFLETNTVPYMDRYYRSRFAP